MRLSPSTVLAAAALFFALGGSALAVHEAVRPQARCAAGAVRGFAAVNGDPAKGIANFPDQFTTDRTLFGARFNCAGGAPQARRVEIGVYEVRFPGNASQLPMVSSGAAETTIGVIAPGTFRVGLWAPGRQNAVDTPFAVAAL